MKREKVDNTAIKAFYDECQEAVSRWNAARHDGGGEIRVSQEFVNKKTDQMLIKIDAEPDAVPGPGRMTMLQIWFDSESSTIMGKTPLLPVDNTQEVTMDVLQSTLNNFNP